MSWAAAEGAGERAHTMMSSFRDVVVEVVGPEQAVQIKLTPGLFKLSHEIDHTLRVSSNDMR